MHVVYHTTLIKFGRCTILKLKCSLWFPEYGPSYSGVQFLSLTLDQCCSPRDQDVGLEARGQK